MSTTLANVSDIEKLLSDPIIYNTVAVKTGSAANIYGSYLFGGVWESAPFETISSTTPFQADDILVLKANVTNPSDSTSTKAKRQIVTLAGKTTIPSTIQKRSFKNIQSIDFIGQAKTSQTIYVPTLHISKHTVKS